MTRAFRKILFLVLIAAPLGLAQYTYSVVDTVMAGPPSSRWTTSNSFGTDMLNAGSEVKATFVAGGFQIYLSTYDCYGACSENGSQNFTTGYQIAISAGSITLNGDWLTGPQGAAPLNYTLTSVTPPTLVAGSVIRALTRNDPAGGVDVIVYVNNALVIFYHDTTLGAVSTGSVGFNFPSGSAASFVSEGDVGVLDTIAPNAIPANQITNTATTNHVHIYWPAATDNTNGIGVYGYQILRNGQLINTVTSLSYNDEAIVPNSTYQYTVRVTDYHWNTTDTTVTIITPSIPPGPPPSATPDGFRTGVKPTGAYWGAGNENIDVLSGNLSFSLPLLKAQGRTGWSVPFSLSYNSQLWQMQNGSSALLGGDAGFGFGWRLAAGSITPYWTGTTLSLVIFTDSTGAEYRLDQNNGNVWSSKESTYVFYDANLDTLHFRDGSYWIMGCVSSASEADAGVMYPTMMEDTSGNQVQISYNQGLNANWRNSSSRINTIQDVRGIPANGPTFTFTYNADSPIPHLASITNSIGMGAQYTFSYLENQAIASPINDHGFQTTFLGSSTVTGIGVVTTLSYDGSGELTQAVLPYGGYVKWAYDTVTYSSGVSYREVQNRYLSKDGTTGSQTTYAFSHEATVTTPIHQFTAINDPGGVGQKHWTFGQSGVGMGLVTQYQGNQVPGPVTKTQNAFIWSQDSAGNSYISSTLTTLDPGQSYQAQSQTTQILDTYGNVTQVNNYNYGNLSTPARTYNYTYLNSSAYTSRYILNRLLTASVTNGTTTTPLATNAYDYSIAGSNCSTNVSQSPAILNWDTNYANITTRGLLTNSVVVNNTSSYCFNELGVGTTVTSNGITTTATSSSSNSYAAPTAISVGSLTTTLGWSSFLGLTNDTGPNGDSSSTYYDSYARQTSTTSPFGAATYYTYNNAPYSSSNPATVTATINIRGVNGRWTKTTMDGLGRTVMTQTGVSESTTSQVETVYNSCGCSPAGKMTQQAMPHLPNASTVYTTYTYDGIGRTLSVLAPDGASTTTYLYQGNTVKVTDPAGKWKLFTMDVLGNLTNVDEPNPGSGSPPPAPVSPPSFSPAPGTYGASQTVTLNSSTSGASIRYTTNGTTPTGTTGTLYSGAFSVSTTTPINAIAYLSGMADSAVMSVTYTINSGGSGPAWYNSGWSYRKAITINSGQVSGTLAYFPMAVSWPSDSSLASSAQATGNDILFTDSTGTFKLNHQIETFTSSTGQLTAWVQVPSLSNGTVIYMYYGNSSAPSQQNAPSVWDSNYMMVQHLPNGSTLSASDSTNNGNNGTLLNSPTATTGKIDGAMQVSNPLGGYASAPQGIAKSSLAGWPIAGGPFTLEGWFYTSSTGTSQTMFNATDGGSNFFALSYDGTGYIEAAYNGG